MVKEAILYVSDIISLTSTNKEFNNNNNNNQETNKNIQETEQDSPTENDLVEMFGSDDSELPDISVGKHIKKLFKHFNQDLTNIFYS